MAKEPPEHPLGPARLLLDSDRGYAALHGLVRALEETADRVFVLAVDLPALSSVVIREIALRGCPDSGAGGSGPGAGGTPSAARRGLDGGRPCPRRSRGSRAASSRSTAWPTRSGAEPFPEEDVAGARSVGRSLSPT